jgi:hypothetical protein
MRKTDTDPQYNAKAVEEAIAASTRRGEKVSKSEAQLIHALLKGWG